VGAGVDRVRIRVRALLEQPLDDVHGLPHAARDEVREPDRTQVDTLLDNLLAERHIRYG
jgi:hypothetical protein